MPKEKNTLYYKVKYKALFIFSWFGDTDSCFMDLTFRKVRHASYLQVLIHYSVIASLQQSCEVGAQMRNFSEVQRNKVT